MLQVTTSVLFYEKEKYYIKIILSYHHHKKIKSPAVAKLLKKYVIIKINSCFRGVSAGAVFPYTAILM